MGSESNLRGITSIDVKSISDSRIVSIRREASSLEDIKQNCDSTNPESLILLDAKVAKLLLRTNKAGREGKTRLLEAFSKRLGAIVGAESKLIKKSSSDEVSS